MEEELSKKELLKQTGISYGQLYRWKREKLIPEEWFRKRSAITGQETFFPKTAILERVKRILELKDKYSLEEMAEMFSPEWSDHLFQEEDLEQFSEITIDIAAKCMDESEKDVFDFREIILMCILSQAYITLKPDEKAVDELVHQLMHLQGNVSIMKHHIAIATIDNLYVWLLYDHACPPILDTRLSIVYEANIQEYANQFKLKYQTVFSFHSQTKGDER